MKPYFYKIKHKVTGKLYIGSQYGKKSDSANFWTTYFTSSKTIQNIVKDEGRDMFEIVSIIERNDAREFEFRYLKKAFSLLGKEMFLERFYNRTLSPGVILTTEITNKITATKKKRWESGKIKKPVPPNWSGKTRSDNMRNKLSESKFGHVVTDSTRLKISIANTGKEQTQSTKDKRKNSLLANDNSYGRKFWLFISPDGIHHVTHGNRNAYLHKLGLSEGPGFINYVNTGNSPKLGKNVGWKFYEGKSVIENILTNVDNSKVIRNEFPND